MIFGKKGKGYEGKYVAAKGKARLLFTPTRSGGVDLNKEFMDQVGAWSEKYITDNGYIPADPLSALPEIADKIRKVKDYGVDVDNPDSVASTMVGGASSLVTPGWNAFGTKSKGWIGDSDTHNNYYEKIANMSENEFEEMLGKKRSDQAAYLDGYTLAGTPPGGGGGGGGGGNPGFGGRGGNLT
jgi:hypothetical protein